MKTKNISVVVQFFICFLVGTTIAQDSNVGSECLYIDETTENLIDGKAREIYLPDRCDITLGECCGHVTPKDKEMKDVDGKIGAEAWLCNYEWSVDYYDVYKELDYHFACVGANRVIYLSMIAAFLSLSTLAI